MLDIGASLFIMWLCFQFDMKFIHIQFKAQADNQISFIFSFKTEKTALIYPDTGQKKAVINSLK